MVPLAAKSKPPDMTDRRQFIKGSVAAGMAVAFFGKLLKAGGSKKPDKAYDLPLVVSTWHHGLAANETAWRTLESGGTVLDAVEQGVRVSEADPEEMSVGYGGFPDADGNVTLDACIMAPNGNAGSVAYLQHIMHPISVARKVMEKTPHVMLSGDGALRFALDNGFTMQDLLTPNAREAWEEWKASGALYAPKANWENHDTIGMIAIEQNADMAGACTTSGMKFKHPGRIGDSPIIGAGLYVDNEVGAATATGEGEAIMKTLGSFLVVELMRNGMAPEEACKEAVKRISRSVYMHKMLQVGYIAINKQGATGGFSLRPGFQYAVHNSEGNVLIDAPFLLDG
jgi:N4-(beta-N-acetylglucosaminyl)-L-asparaginase